MEKLRLLGFTESDEPYSESNAAKFTDNLTLWSGVEYGHIFGYFVYKARPIHARTTPSLETTGLPRPAKKVYIQWNLLP